MNFALVLVAALLAQGPEGAMRLERTTKLQRSAERVWPDPREATKDMPKAHADGCIARFASARSRACVYGHANSATTVVLFGDSHAMQYFPALEPIALGREWRLIVLTKAGCPPGGGPLRHAGRYNRKCEKWRENSLRRMRRERPDLVVTSGATHYRVYAHGRRLTRTGSARALARGYAAMLRRLTRVAPRVIVIRDPIRPPFEVPQCVAAAMDRLRRCAFPRSAAHPSPAIISRTVGRIDGVTVIDPLSRICPTSVCPAVIGNALVWRQTAHITATYAATMTAWLARKLR